MGPYAIWHTCDYIFTLKNHLNQYLLPKSKFELVLIWWNNNNNNNIIIIHNNTLTSILSVLKFWKRLWRQPRNSTMLLSQTHPPAPVLPCASLFHLTLSQETAVCHPNFQPTLPLVQSHSISPILVLISLQTDLWDWFSQWHFNAD